MGGEQQNVETRHEHFDERRLDLKGWHPAAFIDSKEVPLPDLQAFLDEKGAIRFEFFLPRDSFSDCFEDFEMNFAFPNGKSVGFLPTSRKISSDSNGTKVEGILTQSPLILESNIDAETVSGAIYNLAPKSFFKQFVLETRTAKIDFDFVQGASEKFSSATKQKKSVVDVGTFNFTARNGSLDSNEIAKINSTLWHFFRFVVGANVSFGPWKALARDKSLAAIQPDASIYDPPQMVSNWSAFHSSQEISELFGMYCKACDDPKIGIVLNRAFGLYRAATTARHFTGLEIGVIVAQSLLELLCDYTLQNHAGWTSELMKSTRGFHNKLTASASAIGFKGEPLEHAEEVKARYKQSNVKNIK